MTLHHRKVTHVSSERALILYLDVISLSNYCQHGDLWTYLCAHMRLHSTVPQMNEIMVTKDFCVFCFVAV